MTCEACDQMLSSDAPVPHEGLRPLQKPKKLRPLGRRPVLVEAFRCQVCGANWIRESDPGRGSHPEWVCLHRASNILDPHAVSAAESPAAQPTGRPAINQRQGEPRDAPTDQFPAAPRLA
ncbi:conserved hypothetical protein (plasmid) [Burkholderia vietnamiensis G4]|uniref:Uncharacterized protein n=1 Tax=Burkholderia vietnamiensis (strain G4 / LMG 22486) TaxID=269482 RepID=A4JTJ5_BURVG|nr:conserved hypothetical protein [Burkholderia vietnamiensis G4]